MIPSPYLKGEKGRIFVFKANPLILDRFSKKAQKWSKWPPKTWEVALICSKLLKLLVFIISGQKKIVYHNFENQPIRLFLRISFLINCQISKKNVSKCKDSYQNYYVLPTEQPCQERAAYMSQVCIGNTAYIYGTSLVTHN